MRSEASDVLTALSSGSSESLKIALESDSSSCLREALTVTT